MLHVRDRLHSTTGNALEDLICLIIAVHPQRGLPAPTFHAALNSAIARNPDGIGLAWPDGDQVRTLKRLRSYGPVIEQALALYRGTSLPFFVHLRYNTVGINSKANTHPFVVAPDLAMAHNKTLAIQPPDQQWSDSRTVAELLQLLLAGDPAFFNSSLFWSFIEHQAGTDNRFVFLDANSQELLIVNEHLGVDVEGLWFSNLYAWDPGTVGLSRRHSVTNKTNEQDCYWLDRWNYESDRWDAPLAWGTSGMDCRELEPHGIRGLRR